MHFPFPKSASVLAIILYALSHTCSPAADWTASPVPAERRDPQAAGTVAWLRCYLRVPDEMATPAEKDLWRDSIMLSVGDVPGPFSVWLNGEKIAEALSVAPGERRRFKVPKGILVKKSFKCVGPATGGAGGACRRGDGARADGILR